MPRRLLALFILILAIPLAYSCSDDPDDNVVKPDPDAYKSLTVRDNVLFNLEKAWKETSVNSPCQRAPYSISTR